MKKYMIVGRYNGNPGAWFYQNREDVADSYRIIINSGGIAQIYELNDGKYEYVPFQ